MQQCNNNRRTDGSMRQWWPATALVCNSSLQRTPVQCGQQAGLSQLLAGRRRAGGPVVQQQGSLEDGLDELTALCLNGENSSCDTAPAAPSLAGRESAMVLSTKILPVPSSPAPPPIKKKPVLDLSMQDKAGTADSTTMANLLSTLQGTTEQDGSHHATSPLLQEDASEAHMADAQAQQQPHAHKVGVGSDFACGGAAAGHTYDTLLVEDESLDDVPLASMRHHGGEADASIVTARERALPSPLAVARGIGVAGGGNVSSMVMSGGDGGAGMASACKECPGQGVLSSPVQVSGVLEQPGVSVAGPGASVPSCSSSRGSRAGSLGVLGVSGLRVQQAAAPSSLVMPASSPTAVASALRSCVAAAPCCEATPASAEQQQLGPTASPASAGSMPAVAPASAVVVGAPLCARPWGDAGAGAVPGVSECVPVCLPSECLLHPSLQSLLPQPPPQPAARLLYVAVFLTPESRDVLLSMVLPLHPLLHGDHMTLAFKPSRHQLLGFPLGAEAVLRVLGSAADSRVQAAFVEGPTWLQPTSAVASHITLSLAYGAKAAEAGPLIRDALQRAAADPFSSYINGSLGSDGAAAGGGGGTGSYQHLEEALLLVGRVGVCAALPAATAARLRQAGKLGQQPALLLQRQQRQPAVVAALGVAAASYEEQVVLWSIDDVVDSGCCAGMDGSALQQYRELHGSVLGLQATEEEPSPFDLPDSHSPPVLHSVVEPSPAVVAAARSASPLPFLQLLPSPRLSPAVTPAEAYAAAAAVTPRSAVAAAMAAASAAASSPCGDGGAGSAAAGVAGAGASTPTATTPCTPTGGGGSGGGSGGLAQLLSSTRAATCDAGGAGTSAAGAAASDDGAGTAASGAGAGASMPTATTPCTPTGGGGGGGGLLQLLSSTRAQAATAQQSAAAAAMPAGRVAMDNSGSLQASPIRALCLAADSSPRSSSSSSVTSSTTSSSEDAVQFMSAVGVGDYVAVRPFAPTAAHQQVRGYVHEFACDEPFQAQGVLAVLTDDTIGFVTAVLDHVGSSGAGSSRSAAAAAAAAASPAKPAASANCSSSGGGGRKHVGGAAAAVAELQGQPSAGSAGMLEWVDLLGAVQPAATVAAGGDAGRHRNQSDTERDLQLWRDFEALQRQHGEALCSSILESCAMDFGEAVSLIKAQGSSLEEAAAKAAAAAASQQADIAAAKATAEAFHTAAVSRSANLAAGAAAAAPATDEEFVQQLALSLGLSPTSAVQLARLVPHSSAQQVVQQLQQHGGDVNQAADALLGGGEADAATTAGSPSSRGSPSRSQGSAASSSAEARVAASFMASKDAGRVAAARQLCDMYPGLQLDLAELLLQENGDSVSEAAQQLSEMQARELQARTATAAGLAAAHDGAAFSFGNSSSTSGRVAALAPAMAAGASSSAAAAGSSALLAEVADLSEADQLAIFSAMAELDGQLPQQQQPLQSSPPPPPQQQQFADTSLAVSAGPSLSAAAKAAGVQQQPELGPEYFWQPDEAYAQSQHRAAGGRNLQHLQPPPPPPPPPPRPAASMLQQQQLPMGMASYEEMQARRAAKEAADLLYAQAARYTSAANIFLTAAQELLRAKDKAGYEDKIRAAREAQAKAQAARDQAAKVSWTANNQRSAEWLVDLHGLSVPVAMSRFVGQFELLQKMDHPADVVFRVIVGQGHHSENNVPRIKLNVMQYLMEQAERVQAEQGGKPWRVSWEVDPTNPGVIIITIHPRQDEGEA